MKTEEIEAEQHAPATAPEPGYRMSPLAKGVVISALTGSVVLGGILLVPPSSPERSAAPAPGSAGHAMIAAAMGAAASLPDLTALIREREARLRTDPRDAQSWAVLGAAYVEYGLRTADPTYYPKAERALRTSLKTRPTGNVDALDGLAALANARHDYRTAKKWGEASLKLAPKRWTTYPLLIETYGRLGDYKAVDRSLETLTKLRSGAAVMAREGQVYRDRGWRDDALASLTDAAALAATPSEQAACLHRAGELTWERGEPAKALNYFTQALAADPDHHASLAGQGRALASLGRTTEAVQAYRSALAMQPRPEYSLELGELYQSIRFDDAAKAQYALLRKRVAADAANGVDDTLLLGRFEADHGDPRAAVTRLRVEWKRAPSVQTADALGWALHKAGDDQEALKYAKRATDPEHGGTVRSALIAYHRGEVERKLKLDGPARRHIGEALRINSAFSPLLAPLAKEALAALGDPSAGRSDKAPKAEANTAPAPRPHAAPRNPAPARPAPRRPAPESPAARPAAPVAPPKSAAPPATPPAPAKPSPRQAPQTPKPSGA
ncbi:tetratricopeptide repeat protein [Streptomyces sp. NPDC001939]|uniref:tetratricopeptide repeat protein n=2 Tax=Streptomyces TaxID=1883 RepID=UPI001D0AC489|nr:tetratricopeptide repeat protein [Streptomyces longhuiensis]UDM00216.1 tetratricopeptide repeat protein [Streptomyces longhuiensis]